MAKKRKSSFGILFWLALVFFLVVLYLANRMSLTEIITQSGVSNLISGIFGGDYRGSSSTPETKTQDVRPKESVPETTAPYKIPPYTPGAQENPPPQAPVTPAPAPGGLPPLPETEKTHETARPASAAKTGKPNESPAPARVSGETGARTRTGSLYFIRLAETGEVSLVKSSRDISAVSPLRETLQALLAGPTSSEEKAGCISLIPQESRLLSVKVDNGIAFVSFNENFRFNSFGKEGYDGQLKQTVYTITEFPAIRSVQILINGAKIDYLGSEGIFIG
ncbi:MAG: GerMN domain-containing protein, partial [Spirochaetales bacterium]|nr:GerMN domain-containing protein [Spirochaetales bacterium]